MQAIGPETLKASRAPKLELDRCERCGQRAKELMIIGELEGAVIGVCRKCRGRSRFPMKIPRGP